MSREQYKIGTVSVEPGSKGFGHIEVARVYGRYITIPLIVLHGLEDGPTLVVEAAMHGREIVGSIAIATLTRTLDPKKMKGTFVAIPVVNTPGFEAGMRFHPWDNTDLALVLSNPKPEGTVPERTAYVMVNEIFPRADYLIDIHGQGQPSYLLGNLPSSRGNYIVHDIVSTWTWGESEGLPYQEPKIDPEVIRKGKEMMLAWGIESIWWKTTWPTLPHNIAATKGIPAMCSECSLEENIKGITNVMKYIGMLEGKPEPQAKTATLYDASFPIENFGYKGFWIPKVTYLDKVAKGDKLGVILHPYTAEEIACINSPADGFILTKQNPGFTTPEAKWLGSIGSIMETVDL